ncbi:MAG: FadR/GntR family transcriptional regulator [Thermoleophilia bacterium]
MFSPLLSPRAYRAVLDQICNAILAGELEVGDKLDKERELAEQFGVSRPTVREAIKALRLAGVVCVKRGPGGGVFVERDSMPPDLFSTALVTVKKDAEEILEARWAVESMVVELAAQRATPENIHFLSEALGALSAGPKTAARFVSADTKFHLGVARAAQNRRLYKIMEALMKEVYVALEMVPETAEAFRMAEDSLSPVLEALIAHDPVAAKHAMEQHYSETYTAVEYYTAG